MNLDNYNRKSLNKISIVSESKIHKHNWTAARLDSNALRMTTVEIQINATKIL